MKTLQLTKFGRPSDAVRLVEIDSPPPGAGQVRVAVEAAPLNPSDFLLVSGNYGLRPELPSAIGQEGVGKVIEVGDGVDASRVGERVVIAGLGTWAEEIVVDQREAIAVHADADPLQLAMLAINPVTAYALLHSFGDLRPGDWVLQTGGNSAVSGNVISLAKHYGYRTLSVVRRPEAAASVGGDAVLVADENLADNVKKALGGDQAALLLDPIGGPVTRELSTGVRPDGTVVVYGGMSGESVTLTPQDLIFRKLVLRGFWLGFWRRETPAAELARAYDELAALVAKGVITAPIEATYSLDAYADAFTHARGSERTGKILFRP